MAKCRVGNPRCTGGCKGCYEAKQRKKKPSSLTEGVISTAFGIAQSLTGTAASALPGGQQHDEANSKSEWGKTHLRAERDRQSAEVEGGTRSRGSRRRGTNQRR